ncbi:hypothetical protein MBLNU230_g4406t1 [Neophaeotheca triangularis]
MRWPEWLSSRPSTADHDNISDSPVLPKPTGSWSSNLNSTDWSHYTTPQTIIASVVTTATTIALIRLYKTYLRRIPTVEYLKPSLFRQRSLYGYVTSVGDGDNFRLFHTPGGRWLGWGWIPGRKIQHKTPKEVKDQTVHVRIAGVDAPELAHFGRPAQPYGQEALEWLKSNISGNYVRAYPYRRDQYDRIVCSVYRRKFLFFKSDVGLNMLRSGLATVYEAKFGSEFGGQEENYKAAEERAKQKGVGMWQAPGLVDKMLGRNGSKKQHESPREYKTRMAKQDQKAKK